MNISKLLQALVLAIAMAAGGAAAPAVAQDDDMNVRVIVPDAPGGARFSGCYTVTQRLYGPYRMEFCLKQRGTYTVRGGGVTCNGRLDWDARGRNINIDLRRTPCGNGVAWSADSMTCQGTGLFGKNNPLAGLLARIIVPDIPTIATLSCTYDPAVRGEKSVRITARRTS